MIVRWEREDLTEIIKKLLPAYIEITSYTGEYKLFSPDLENSPEFDEALCSIVMTFFLNKSPCSLLIIQEDSMFSDILKYYGYQIKTKTFDKEIVLDFKALPEGFIQEHLF